MTIGFMFLGVAVLLGLVMLWAEEDIVSGALTAAVSAAVVLGIWAVIAHVVSPYNQDKCEESAAGYGIEEANWSFKHKCRVKLPSGHTVREDRIRITSDGKLFVGGGEGDD